MYYFRTSFMRNYFLARTRMNSSVVILSHKSTRKFHHNDFCSVLFEHRWGRPSNERVNAIHSLAVIRKHSSYYRSFTTNNSISFTWIHYKIPPARWCSFFKYCTRDHVNGTNKRLSDRRCEVLPFHFDLCVPCKNIFNCFLFIWFRLDEGHVIFSYILPPPTLCFMFIVCI